MDLISKRASGEISLHKDADDHWTLGGLESFVSEARMAGVGDSGKLSFNKSGDPARMYFQTTDQFIQTTTDGRPLIQKDYNKFLVFLVLMLMSALVLSLTVFN